MDAADSQGLGGYDFPSGPAQGADASTTSATTPATTHGSSSGRLARGRRVSFQIQNNDDGEGISTTPTTAAAAAREADRDASHVSIDIDSGRGGGRRAGSLPRPATATIHVPSGAAAGPAGCNVTFLIDVSQDGGDGGCPTTTRAATKPMTAAAPKGSIMNNINNNVAVNTGTLLVDMLFPHTAAAPTPTLRSRRSASVSVGDDNGGGSVPVITSAHPGGFHQLQASFNDDRRYRHGKANTNDNDNDDAGDGDLSIRTAISRDEVVERGGGIGIGGGGGAIISGISPIDTDSQELEEPDGPVPYSAAGKLFGESFDVQPGDDDAGGNSNNNKASGRRGGMWTQLLALLERTGQQYWRNKLSTLAEVIVPLIFIVLAIVLDVAFGDEKIAAKNNLAAEAFAFQIDSMDYRTYMCYDDGGGYPPIGDLYPCSVLGEYNCSGDSSGLPVEGFCYWAVLGSAYGIVAQYVESLTGPAVALPKLDAIITHQWLAKKAGLASDSRSRTALAALMSVGLGVSSSTRYESITHSGALLFAPRANIPSDLIPFFQSQSTLFQYVNGGIFDTVAEAEAYAQKHTVDITAKDSVWGIVVVNSDWNGLLPSGGGGEPTLADFDVEIQLNTGALPEMSPTVTVNYPAGYNYDGSDMYLASGYVSIQKILYDYFIERQRGTTVTSAGSTFTTPYADATTYPMVAGFPTIAGKRRYIIELVGPLIAFIVVLAFLYPFSQMTKRLVMEKELRIREAMLVMGLSRTALWLNYFIVSFLQNLLTCILVCLLLCGCIVPRSNPYVVFLMLLVYSCTLIPLVGLVSTLFSKARLAALLSPLIYFVLSMIIFAMGRSAESVALGLSIFSPTAIAALLSSVMLGEGGSGFSPGDLAGKNPFINPAPYKIMIMMAGDFFIYTIIMLYLDAVVPQDWGSTRHPLFFAIDPYRAIRDKCSGAKEKEKKRLEAEEQQQDSGNDDDPCFDPAAGIDPVTSQRKIATVRIDGLVKGYRRGGKKFAVVDHLSWRLYPGEISVLLGPNGSGKSTTVNMITGMVQPDGGDCTVAGYSVRRSLAAARHEIGFCPQHNILWPDLTCHQHLEFYAKIKGLRGADLEDAVTDVLRAVDLADKVDYIPGMLSGGQKRKLSVAVAFVGRNRIVLLDEPTSGMDATARRHTWSLLRAMAVNRTILLTTHYMDEADLLGDHVAIMSEGAMQCAGSSLFLRTHAGSGYTLRFDLLPVTRATTAGGGNSSNNSNEDVHDASGNAAVRDGGLSATWGQLDRAVRRHVPDATLILQTDAEVEYCLPLAYEQLLHSLLRQFEQRGNREMGIRSYALTAPTLEDVFMNIVQASHSSNSDNNKGGGGGGGATATTTTEAAAGAHRRTGSGSGSGSTAAGPRLQRRASASAAGSPLLAVRRMSRASFRYVTGDARATAADGGGGGEDALHEGQLDAVRCPEKSRAADDDNDADRGRVYSTGGGGGGPPRADPLHMDSINEGEDMATMERPEQQQDALDFPDSIFGPFLASPSRAGMAAAAASAAAPPSAAPAAGKRASLPPLSGGAAASPVPEAPHSPYGDTFTGGHQEQNNRGSNTAHLMSLAAEADKNVDDVWRATPVTTRGALLNLQLEGMLVKRFLYSLRDRRMQFFQIVCPVLCILLAMLLQLVHSSETSSMVLVPGSLFGPDTTTALDLSRCVPLFDAVNNQQLSVFAVAAANGGRGEDNGEARVNFTDSNFVSALDMGYSLMDTWYTHVNPRYAAVQCMDPVLFLQLVKVFPGSVIGRMPFVTLYNSSSKHSLPYGLGATFQIMYYQGLHNAGVSPETIANTKFVTRVKALPQAKEEKQLANTLASLLIGVIVLIPFTFLPANPVAWVVKEREVSARHLQTLSGLPYLIYWGGNFIYDFIAYLVTMALVIIIFLIFRRWEYVGGEAVGALITSFVLYGLCCCTGSYAVSFFFSDHTTAQVVVMGCSFITGFICVILVFILGMLEWTLNASNIMRWVFRAIPSYAVGEVIMGLALLDQTRLQTPELGPWSMRITGWANVYMAAEIPVFVAMTLLWDHPNRRAVVDKVRRCFDRVFCCCCNRRSAGRDQQQQQHEKDEGRELVYRYNQPRDQPAHEVAVPRGTRDKDGRRVRFSAVEVIAGTSAKNTATARSITTAAAAKAAAAAGGGGGGVSGDNTSDEVVLVGTPLRHSGAPVGKDGTPGDRTRHLVTPFNDVHDDDVRGRAGWTASPGATGEAALARQRRASIAEQRCFSDNFARRASFRASITNAAAAREHRHLSAASDSVGGGGVVAESITSILVFNPTTPSAGVAAAAIDPTPLRHVDADKNNAATTTATGQRAHVPSLAVDDLALRRHTSAVAAAAAGRRATAAAATTPATTHNSNSISTRHAPAPPYSSHMYPAPHLEPGDYANQAKEDSDVEEERLAVYQDERQLSNLDVVRFVDLRKVYDNGKVAVRSLSFSVMPGEVFGFLGTNGAGKSTAISVLTQEQLPSSGRAYVCGNDVVRDSTAAMRCIGYCPQFDACFDLLTVREHIALYARIRGIDAAQRGPLVESLMKLCELTMYQDVLSHELSGGNRRKLSVTIALLGGPRVVCLDEPSAGMDPIARRLLWRALDRVSKKCSIVLTTHHLEEVEALADTVAIMVDGGLRCIGDLSHLKHKYARNAYELSIRVGRPGQQKKQQQAAGMAREGADHNNAISSAPTAPIGVFVFPWSRSGSVGNGTLDGCEGESQTTHSNASLSVASPHFFRPRPDEGNNINDDDDERGGGEILSGGSPHDPPTAAAATCRGSIPTLDDNNSIRVKQRNRSQSITYGGADLINVDSAIVQFMAQHMPSALLVENFNDERYVYSIPATRDVARAMAALQEELLQHCRRTRQRQQRAAAAASPQQQRRRTSTAAAAAAAAAARPNRSSSNGVGGGGGGGGGGDAADCEDNDNKHSCGDRYTQSIRARAAAKIVCLSDVFELLQRNKQRLGISEYSVSQVSLEQVFLRVAEASEDHQYHNEENNRVKSKSNKAVAAAAAAAAAARENVGKDSDNDHDDSAAAGNNSSTRGMSVSAHSPGGAFGSPVMRPRVGSFAGAIGGGGGTPGGLNRSNSLYRVLATHRRIASAMSPSPGAAAADGGRYFAVADSSNNNPVSNSAGASSAYHANVQRILNAGNSASFRDGVGGGGGGTYAKYRRARAEQRQRTFEAEKDRRHDSEPDRMV